MLIRFPVALSSILIALGSSVAASVYTQALVEPLGCQDDFCPKNGALLTGSAPEAIAALTPHVESLMDCQDGPCPKNGVALSGLAALSTLRPGG